MCKKWFCMSDCELKFVYFEDFDVFHRLVFMFCVQRQVNTKL